MLAFKRILVLEVLGIGHAYDATARYRWYWTTEFGGDTDEPVAR